MATFETWRHCTHHNDMIPSVAVYSDGSTKCMVCGAATVTFETLLKGPTWVHPERVVTRTNVDIFHERTKGSFWRGFIDVMALPFESLRKFGNFILQAFKDD